MVAELTVQLINWAPPDTCQPFCYLLLLTATHWFKLPSHYPFQFYTCYSLCYSLLIIRYDHWGHFHELGHNHQQGAWTWACTGEVTVNFFSARAQYVVRNQTNPANFYGWNAADYTSRAIKRAEYFAAGANYTTLCATNKLYLDSFLQVRVTGNECPFVPFSGSLIRLTDEEEQKQSSYLSLS
jgi:hypothetical protein